MSSNKFNIGGIVVSNNTGLVYTIIDLNGYYIHIKSHNEGSVGWCSYRLFTKVEQETTKPVDKQTIKLSDYHEPPKPEIKYPILMRGKTETKGYKFVVMFVKEDCAIVVSNKAASGYYPIGHVMYNIDINNYEPYDGEITLKN